MKNIFKTITVWILTLEARAVLRRYNPKIIAVTGSVGKTATKDAIYSAISRGAHARKSEKTFNTEVGVPLTILGAPNAWQNPFKWLLVFFDGLFLILFKARYPKWLVLEMGADKPGDIRWLASWVTADVVVITRLPEVPTHVEFFDSPEQLVEEKAALIGALRPGGTLILFGDDERTANLRTRTTERVITFGLTERSQVRAEALALLFEEGENLPAGRQGWPIGMQALLHVGETFAPVSMIGALGGHALLPLVAAASVGQALGKSVAEIVEALKSYEPPPGRMHLLRGVKNTLIIDDSYNSSPAAATAALDTLALVAPKARRVAVLGDMLELGRHSSVEHRKVGEYAAKCADILVTVGFRARDIAQGALDSGIPDANIFQYEDAQIAGAELDDIVQEGDCILIKGSQSIRMERVVEELMAEPERAKDLLVRQDEEWKKR